MIKYCLPIIKNTKKEVLSALQSKGFAYFEIWLDYIKDLDQAFLADIAQKNKGKLIFVFRRKDSEKTKLNLEKRIAIISSLSKYANFLDLDFLSQYEEIKYVKQNSGKIRLILSFHHFRETPSVDYLKNLLNKMKQFKPEIYKIAVFCKKEADSLLLLNLLLQVKEQKLKIIVLGMGEKGLITRIFGTLWGNEMIFAPKVITQKSAPGQLTLLQLSAIFKLINTSVTYGRK